MALPSNVQFGTVVGRFMRAVADGPDAGRDPDGIPLEGLTVKFIPSADRFRNATATPPVLIVADQITATTNEDGYLVGPDGEQGIRLLATDDPDLNPTGWTWEVAISGTNFRTLTFKFALPSDTTIDLATVVPVPGNPGQAMQEWLAAVEATQSAATSAEQSAIVAVEARDEAVSAASAVEQVVATNDGIMTAVATNDESSFAQTLNNKIGATVGEFGVTGSSPLGGLGTLRAALALHAIAPVAVVQTGSSTARGTGASTPEKAFFSLLVAAMQSAYPAGGAESAVQASTTADFTLLDVPGVHGYNASEGSTLSNNYLTNAERDKIIALTPRVIFHQVGGNDYYYGVHPETYKANLVASIDYFKTNMATPCVHVLTQPHQMMSIADPAYPWSDYGNMQREIAEADPENVVYLDLSGPFRLAGVPGSDPFGLVGSDDVHLTDTGHALMFDLIRNGLELPSVSAGSSKTVIIITQPNPPDGPGIFTSDSFSGADAPTIVGRTSDAGLGGSTAAWVASNNNAGFAISGGQLVGGAGSSQFVGVPAISYQQGISAKVVTPPSGSNSLWLALGRTPLAGPDGYRLLITQTSIRMQVWMTSNWSDLNASVAYSAGDRVGIYRDSQGVMWMTVNGEQVGDAATDVSHTAPGYLGIAKSFTPTFALDDIAFEVPDPYDL